MKINYFQPIKIDLTKKDPQRKRGPYNEFDPNYNFDVHLRELDDDLIIANLSQRPIICFNYYPLDILEIVD